jgi:hypothetical protein
MITRVLLLLFFGVHFFCCLPVRGFALLGPYAPWMDPTNSYRSGLDIGGPVDLTQGYRWNVPFVTYGFDQSFIDYFGSNGVYAVEQAFQTLNELPPASTLQLTNFPADCFRLNYIAASQHVYDLKTATLAVLLEQIGLTDPQRSMFVLKQWSSAFLADSSLYDYTASFLSDYILERNFDPDSLAPSAYVNGFLYTGEIIIWGPFNPYPRLAYGYAQMIDPLTQDPTAASDLIHIVRPVLTAIGWSDGLGFAGTYFSSFSQDDVGGIRYLLSTNNVEPEVLLPDVYGTGTNIAAFVNGAIRPGLNKITFVRQPFEVQSGLFLSLTNDFIDSYFTNGILQHQQLERVTTQPDFLFSVTDTAATDSQGPFCVRSGTDHWWNSSSTNSGPGVIRPPINIVFNKPGPWLQTDESVAQETNYSLVDFHWASFDGSTNPVVTYPTDVSTGASNNFAVHFWLLGPSAIKVTDWQPSLAAGTAVALQTSTNLTDWISITTVTNTDGPVLWRHVYTDPVGPQRYFRVLPK